MAPRANFQFLEHWQRQIHSFVIELDQHAIYNTTWLYQYQTCWIFSCVSWHVLIIISSVIFSLYIWRVPLPSLFNRCWLQFLGSIAFSFLKNTIIFVHGSIDDHLLLLWDIHCSNCLAGASRPSQYSGQSRLAKLQKQQGRWTADGRNFEERIWRIWSGKMMWSLQSHCMMPEATPKTWVLQAVAKLVFKLSLGIRSLRTVAAVVQGCYLEAPGSQNLLAVFEKTRMADVVM